MKENHNKYDIIGDIHGYAAELRALLAKLGYEELDGAYRHPQGRTVIFLGDWIDRGPEIRDVLRIARAMHVAGSALAVPGNHEFNALAYATPDGKGDWMRKHTRKNNEQHEATLAQFAGSEDEWNDHLEWFRTLPATDVPGAETPKDEDSPEALAARFAAITDPRAQTAFWRSLTAEQRAAILKAQ